MDEVNDLDFNGHIDPLIAVNAIPYALEAYNIFVSRDSFVQKAYETAAEADGGIKESVDDVAKNLEKLHKTNIKIVLCILVICYSVTGDNENSDKYEVLLRNL